MCENPHGNGNLGIRLGAGQAGVEDECPDPVARAAAVWKRAAKIYYREIRNWAHTHIDTLSYLERDYTRMFENLTATQRRCTELLEETRRLRAALKAIAKCDGGRGLMPEMAQAALRGEALPGPVQGIPTGRV